MALSVITTKIDAELSDPVRTELEIIVKEAAGDARSGETLEQRMRRGWNNLGCPPWWRFVLCWNGEGGNFSAQFAMKMQKSYCNWKGVGNKHLSADLKGYNDG